MVLRKPNHDYTTPRELPSLESYNWPDLEERFPRLTKTETRVSSLFVMNPNFTVADVASSLGMAPGTVKAHLNVILGKLQIETRDQLKQVWPRLVEGAKKNE